VELDSRHRPRRAEIANTLAYGLGNGRIESMNQKIRLLVRRAYVVRSTHALIAVIRFCLADYARPIPTKKPDHGESGP
jgi:transposase